MQSLIAVGLQITHVMGKCRGNTSGTHSFIIIMVCVNKVDCTVISTGINTCNLNWVKLLKFRICLAGTVVKKIIGKTSFRDLFAQTTSSCNKIMNFRHIDPQTVQSQRNVR